MQGKNYLFSTNFTAQGLTEDKADRLKGRLLPSHSSETDKVQKYLPAVTKGKNCFACSQSSSKYYFEVKISLLKTII